MSETTTVAPSTPAVTTPSPAVSTATEGTPAPIVPNTVTEARESASQWRARINRGEPKPGAVTSPTPTASETPSPSVDATGRAHGPDGKFVPKPTGAEPVASSQAPAIASEGGATPTQTAAEAAAERVRIALEEGHPLRERGFTELPFEVPKEHEEIARWLAGQPVKKREISEAYEARRQAERAALEARAEAEFWRENSGSFLTPEFYHQYADIKQTYGEQAAEVFRRGQMEAANAKLGEKRAEVQRTMAQQEVVATAQAFRAAAIQDAAQQFPGWSAGEVEQALQAYGAWIAARGVTEPTAEDWYRIARPAYESSPAGQARRAAEAQRIQAEANQRAQEEARQREQQALEQAAQARARNPLGATPNVQTGLSVPGATGGPKTAAEFKQQLAQRARGY